MKKILGITVTDEEFDKLFCEQAKGKELKIKNGKIITVEHELTSFEINQTELDKLLNWFNEYDNQVKQYERCQRLGIKFDKDIKKLDNEAKANQERIRELRKLLEED